MAITATQKIENKQKMDYAAQEIKKFLHKEFGMQADIPYSENGRLRVAMGRLLYFTRKDPRTLKTAYYDFKIEYNSKFLLAATKEQVAAVGKHEALHYALMTQGKPFKDGSVLFEALLAKYNLPSHQDNRTITSAAVKATQTVRDKPHYYAMCPKCKMIVGEWKNVPNVFRFSRATTKCCHVSPEFLGKMSKSDIDNKVVFGKYVG